MGATAAAVAEFFSAEGVASAAAAGAAGAGAAVVANAVLPSKGSVPMPEIKPPTAMPDPLEAQKAKEKSIIEQLARRGRQASILTNPPASGTLGG